MAKLIDHWTATKKTVRKIGKAGAERDVLESSGFFERMRRLKGEGRLERVVASLNEWDGAIATFAGAQRITSLQRDKLTKGPAYHYYRFICQTIAGRSINWRELKFTILFVFKAGGNDLKEIFWTVPGNGLTHIPWLHAVWSDQKGDFTLDYRGSPTRLGLQFG